MTLELSSNLSQQLLIFSATLVVVLIACRWYKRRNYPPGPFGLPLVGYLPFLGKEPHKKLHEISKKYGDIFSVNLGSAYAIIISNYDIAKEILVHPFTLARPFNAFDFIPGKGGFSGHSGPEWQEQRRFCMSTMRTLGLGRGVWETLIQEDAVEFVEEIQSWKGKASDIYGPLSLSQASNNIALLIGRRLPKSRSNPDIQVIQKTMDVVLKYVSAASVAVNEPWIVKYLVALRISGYHTLIAILKDFENIFRREVTQRIQSKEPLHTTDFIGYYLQELEKLKGTDRKHYFSVDSLIGHMVVLFVAGSDSTLSSLNWLLLIMAAYPEVQKKVQAELDDVIGRDGQAYWDERNKLPYTMAAIMEMERWVVINPVFPPRRVTDSFDIRGYTIPKGSSIICNSWAIMNDPKYHKNPQEYRPERFLTENGKDIVKLDGYSPFSIGKRNCPGETVALMTIFLYYAAVMQKFFVSTPNGKKIDFKAEFGAVMHPKRQNICFTER